MWLCCLVTEMYVHSLATVHSDLSNMLAEQKDPILLEESTTQQKRKCFVFLKHSKDILLIFGDTCEPNRIHITHLVIILSTPTKIVLYLFTCVKPTRVGLIFAAFVGLGKKRLTALDTVNRFASDLTGRFILIIWTT